MKLEVGGDPAHALLFAADGSHATRLHLQKNCFQKLEGEEVHLFHDPGEFYDAGEAAHPGDQTVDFRRPDEGAAGEGEVEADIFEFFHQIAVVVEGESFAYTADPVHVLFVGLADQEKRKAGAVDMVVDAVFRLLFGGAQTEAEFQFALKSAHNMSGGESFGTGKNRERERESDPPGECREMQQFMKHFFSLSLHR